MRGMHDRSLIPALEKLATFTEKRHVLLANNVANIDTPFYKQQDLPVGEFHELLSKAVNKNDASYTREFKMGESQHVRTGEHGELIAEPVFTQETSQMRRDQNTVGMEQAMTELSKNSMMHNITISLLKSKFDGIDAAIRGRA
jgi:flagellar basal-body rod protein FlgB